MSSISQCEGGHLVDNKIMKDYEECFYYQMVVLNALNMLSPNSLTKVDICSLLKKQSQNDCIINTVIGTMLSKGIIYPNFVEGTIVYTITEFGTYFFNKLRDENREYFERVNLEVKI